jgi:choline dehydrogenase
MDEKMNTLQDPNPSPAESARSKLASHAKAFDFIVCGSGSSGSVVASRLAADPAVNVLLIEAGGSDATENVTNPNFWVRNLGGDLDWGFKAESNSRLNGRAIPYSMGKVLGGGSSINVGTWSRGHRTDWDSFAAAAQDPDWSYAHILDIYKRCIENWTGVADPDYRGTGGAMHVQPAADPHAFALALLDAAAEAGVERFENSSGRMMEAAGGCAVVDENVRDGVRQSVYQSYVHPRLHQANLMVATDATVTRILFERNRASAVEVLMNGAIVTIKASREIVLSMGAIQTPKILMQSGIGDPEELRRFGIPVVQGLPGVGRNLHDHVEIGLVWEASDKALPRVPRSQMVCFWKTRPELEAPNFYSYARAGTQATAENMAEIEYPANTWSLVSGMRPASRGSIHLTGANASDPVRIEANYLADPNDLRDLTLAIGQAREIGNARAMKPFVKREVAPAGLNGPELEHYIRNGLGTFWHQSCTAKMGTDEMSVVDGKLRIHGLKGIRIADASILPSVTVGNTMAPCVAIGERAAEILQAEHGTAA